MENLNTKLVQLHHELADVLLKTQHLKPLVAQGAPVIPQKAVELAFAKKAAAGTLKMVKAMAKHRDADGAIFDTLGDFSEAVFGQVKESTHAGHYQGRGRSLSWSLKLQVEEEELARFLRAGLPEIRAYVGAC